MCETKKQAEVGPCSYCNEDADLVPEHVVPRAIFVNENQSILVIPACHRCNNDKSAGEDDLRDWLVITVGVDGHPDILPLMRNMAESTGKGFSPIGRAVSEQRNPAFRTTPAGLHVPAFRIEIPDVRSMRRALRYIVRGLAFNETGVPWLPELPMVVYEPDGENADSLEETIDLFSLMGPVEFRGMMGNDVFRFASITQEQHPAITAWLLVFFGTVPVVGITGIPAREDERREPTFEELLLNKGRRERRLKRIVDRGLVTAPPDDLLGFLQRFEEKKRRELKN